jgi:hypothetical protein
MDTLEASTAENISTKAETVSEVSAEGTGEGQWYKSRMEALTIHQMMVL